MNSIFCIQPYRVGSSFWLFDDKQRGLLGEAFVAGMSEIISHFVGNSDRCMIQFSENEFPECMGKLEQSSTSHGGTNYILTLTDGEVMNGWLCPALFKYFDKAPKFIYFNIKEQHHELSRNARSG